jgi:hypothetical protein
MTPGEVGGLQALAMQHGGSLSINPQTGLPEANFLKNLLPTLLGVGLSFIPGVGPLAAGMAVGGLETVRTGDLGRGLMAGLGAYGGANLAGSLSAVGAQQGVQAAGAAGQDLMSQAITTPATAITETGAGAGLIPTSAPATTIGDIYQAGGARDALLMRSAETLPASVQALPTPTAPTFSSNVAQAGQGLKNIFTPGDVGTAARQTFMDVSGGPVGLATDVGMSSAPAAFATPEYAPPAQEKEEPYEGPYTPTRRQVRYPTEEERRRMGTGEFTYFTPSNPVPFAEGGDVSAPSMTPAEAQVYSQIANVQRLAGLPAIDTSRFVVTPGVDRAALVYNPISRYEPNYGFQGLGSGIGPEPDYGFERIGDAAIQAEQNAAASGPAFFQPVGGYRMGYGNINNPLDSRFSARFNQADIDPDDYRLKYKPYSPEGRINMANYEYDPILGGYLKKPVMIGDSSPEDGGYGYYTYNYAKGGSVPQLENGGFVLTKKAVDGLGKGNNKKGQQVASRGLGAIPIKGPGTGTSDSIPTSIDGKRPARVSNGEAYVPKKQVAKHGGAKKFYALMKKAERRA